MTPQGRKPMKDYQAPRLLIMWLTKDDVVRTSPIWEGGEEAAETDKGVPDFFGNE